MYKDLRGVGESCNDRRSYNITFETLCVSSRRFIDSAQSLFQVMVRTIEAYPSNLELIAALFKCLLAFVYLPPLILTSRDNHECRVDSGATSTNGIELFKHTALIICGYSHYLLDTNIDYVATSLLSHIQATAPDALFRCARLLLQVMNTALSAPASSL